MASTPDILDRIIRPQQGGFSEEHARYVLSLDFTSDEQARYADLAAKAQEGSSALAEKAELDHLLMVNAMLAVLQSKARVSLKKHNSAT